MTIVKVVTYIDEVPVGGSLFSGFIFSVGLDEIIGSYGTRSVG